MTILFCTSILIWPCPVPRCIIVYIFTVNGVSLVAGHVAEKLGPHVKKHGAKLIPESMKTSKDGQASNLDGAKFVAASSVQGMHQYKWKPQDQATVH